MFIRKIISVMA